jgi:hypothetical protein
VFRRRRALAASLCLAIVLVAACLPGLAALDWVVFELPWALLPDDRTARAAEALPPPNGQPRSLFALFPPRAPPAANAA